MKTRWPAALAASALLHLAFGGAAFVALRRASPPAATTSPKPRAVEVLRVGALLPRAGAPLQPAGLEPSMATGPATTDNGEARAPAGTEPRLNEAPAGAVSPSTTTSGASPPGNDSAGAAGDSSTPGDGSDHGAAGSEGVARDANTAGDASGDTSAAGDSNTPGDERGRGAASPTPGASEAAAEALALEVHARLRAAARECYPAQARRFRQQGRVPVNFCVASGGGPERVVVSPSGQALLDEAAEGCVLRRAAPFPPRASGQCFAVNVEFSADGR